MTLAPEAAAQINTIVTKSQSASEAIAAAQRQIATRQDDIRRASQNRPRTSAEEDELAKLSATALSLSTADVQLGLTTVEALNTSAAAKAMKDQLDGINNDLKAKAAEVQSVADTITKIGDAVSKVDAVLKSVVSLLPLL